MSEKEGPGLWWQLLEFMGMTWPGHKAAAAPELGPSCPACGNPSHRQAGGWACPHHPHATIPEQPTPP